MDISVIIVNYKTKELTRQCVESIKQFTENVDYEIIIIDNASGDDSVQYLSNLFPDSCIINNPENIGFGPACNQGIKKASGEFILLLNSDAHIKNNSLKIFYDFYKKNSSAIDIATLSCMLKDEAGEVVQSHESFPTPYNIITSLMKNSLWRLGLPSRIFHHEFDGRDFRPVDYNIGAALFMETERFRSYDGFDPVFFMYFEEADLQYRMLKDGYRSYIIAGPHIVHLEGKSSENSNNRQQIIMNQSMFNYFRKHRSKVQVFLFRYLYFLFRIPVLLNRRCSFTENVKYLRHILIC